MLTRTWPSALPHTAIRLLGTFAKVNSSKGLPAYANTKHIYGIFFCNFREMLVLQKTKYTLDIIVIPRYEAISIISEVSLLRHLGVIIIKSGIRYLRSY